MLRFYQVDASHEWWEGVSQFPDRLIYHTDEWIRFVAETRNATPVFADVYDGTSRVGCFFSLVFSRFGIRVLGSPFPGWTTPYMGFTLEPSVPRWMALQGLEQFAFHDLGCLHFEIVDRLMTAEDGDRAGLETHFCCSHETDLTKSEEEILSDMESSCRRCIRKAAKCGLSLEESPGDETFAHEYYAQLNDVFAKQGLVPTYSLDHVRKFIEHLYPTGRLLLLRARDPGGNCIATGIYPGMGPLAEFWGNASFRAYQHFRPNEALHWHAMRYWRNRGAKYFDWGGAAAYKEKYGCRRVIVPRFSKSRVPLIAKLRDQAQGLYRQKLRIQGWLTQRMRTAGESPRPLTRTVVQPR